MKKGLFFFVSAIILFFIMAFLAFPPSENTVVSKNTSIPLSDTPPEEIYENLHENLESKKAQNNKPAIPLNLGLLLFVFSILMFIIFIIIYPKIAYSTATFNLDGASLDNQATNEISQEGKDSLKAQMDVIRLTFSIVLSFIVVLAALYIIIYQDDVPESQKWAYGAVGTIIGYWFKT